MRTKIEDVEMKIESLMETLFRQRARYCAFGKDACRTFPEIEGAIANFLEWYQGEFIGDDTHERKYKFTIEKL